MEIKEGIGFQNLKLGITQDQVIAINGDADLINDIDEESDQFIIYYYYQDQVKLYFDKDRNFRLYSIETFHKKSLYLKTEILEMKEEDLRKLLFKNRLKYEVEEYPNFMLFYVPSHQIYLNVEMDRVRSVEIQPFFKDKKVVWPI